MVKSVKLAVPPWLTTPNPEELIVPPVIGVLTEDTSLPYALNVPELDTAK